MINQFDYHNSKTIEITLKHSPGVPDATLHYIKSVIQAAISNPNSIPKVVHNESFDECSDDFNENSCNHKISNLSPSIQKYSDEEETNARNRGRGRPSKSHEEPMNIEEFVNAPPEKRKYLELRYRNNLACRLARRKRKIQEQEIFSEELLEIQRNDKLKSELKKYELKKIALVNYLEKLKKTSNSEDSYKNIHSFKMFKMKAHKAIGGNFQANYKMPPTTSAEIC